MRTFWSLSDKSVIPSFELSDMMGGWGRAQPRAAIRSHRDGTLDTLNCRTEMDPCYRRRRQGSAAGDETSPTRASLRVRGYALECGCVCVCVYKPVMDSWRTERRRVKGSGGIRAWKGECEDVRDEATRRRRPVVRDDHQAVRPQRQSEKPLAVLSPLVLSAVSAIEL